MRYVVFSKRTAIAAAVLAIVGLGACTSEMGRPWPSAPGNGITNFVLTPLSPAALREAKPNRVKYRDSGIKPTWGRTGTSYLEARALLGSDGVTLIQATTGSFEGTARIARIERIQLKVANTTLPVLNERPQSSDWSHSLEGLTLDDVIQLQAHVRGADGPGTQVIHVTTQVMRRPDLAVSTISATGQAYANTPVTFSVPVQERNGNMGARADCVLSVDGVSVDQATDIWVDANGLVTCQFSHAFPLTGTYTVGIAATNVNPGDWDMSNNSSSATITIVAPGTPIAFGQLSANDEAYTYTFTSTRTGDYPIEAIVTGSNMRSYVSFFGTTVDPVPAPMQRVDAKVSADGNEVYSSSLTPTRAWRYDDGRAIVDCAEYTLKGEIAQSCSSTFRNGTTAAWFSYSHSSGTVTYYGNTLYCSTFGCNTYTDNRADVVTGWGERYGLSTGSVVRVELSFMDASGMARTIDRSVTLVDASASENYDDSGCYDFFDGLGQVCWREQSAGTVWRGTMVW